MKKKRRNILNVTLEEEQKLLKSVEACEWKSVDNLAEVIAIAQEAAENFLRKDERE